MRRIKIIKEKIEQREKKERECYNNRDKGNKRRYRESGVEEWLKRGHLK
jgi:hypothetical protein